MQLTREQILAHVAPVREEVAVPQLGGSVFVATLTAGERDRYEIAQHEENQKERGLNYRARLVAATACDGEGKALFSEADVPAISALPCAVVDPIVEVALRVNGFTKADAKQLAAVSPA